MTNKDIVKSVSVVGLGKLGSPLVACLANKGFNVIGNDLNQGLVDKIHAAKAPFEEPMLDEMLNKNAKRISATTSYAKIMESTDVTFIIVPTPSNSDGSFSNEYLKSAVKSLGESFKNLNKWHLFVITSTVLPGSMDKELVPAFEQASGKKINVDFGVCYSPLFIALGSVVKNILNPDFTLIGESDEKSGLLLENIYKQMVDNQSSSKRMNFVNAELSKISVNTYVTMKISFANQLAEMCEGLDNSDVAVVSAAVGSDTRIGNKYIKGALGYGGPCFPRDSQAFAWVAKKLGTTAPLAESTDIINHRQIDRIVKKIANQLPSASNVSVIGMSYKPDTPVIEESQGIMIVQSLINSGHKVTVFDPLAMDNTKTVFGQKINYVTCIKDSLQGADCVVVALPGNDYNPNPLDLEKNKKTIVIDCWGTLNRQHFSEVANYIRIGEGKK